MQWIDLACQHVQLQREGENEEKKEKKKEKALLTTITLRWYKHTLWKDHKTN